MAALYFTALGPNDRVSVKPHAGPILHAIEYLLGNQSIEQLRKFRGLGGVQSYPSRTKDRISVDFSTGSVGLGVAITAFASLAQDYLIAHGHIAQADAGRMVALMGDAELDEGNIYECLIEAFKHQVRNCWWIIDYNRQSLDATTADRMFRRFDDIFKTCGWRVLTLKYGRLQKDAFKRPGGRSLKEWIDCCPNADFSALTYQGGVGWRARLIADIGDNVGVRDLVGSLSDDELAGIMTNLGGHCMPTLLDAFAQAQDDKPTLFIAYTVKGYGLPLAGHKDNHAGLLNPAQIAEFRKKLNIAEGQEWEPYGGLGDNSARALKMFIERSTVRQRAGTRAFDSVPVPRHLPVPTEREQSTQWAFGRILLDLAKSGHPLSDRIVTTSPDVTVSTNLGAFVNQRGLFRRQNLADAFQLAKIPSVQKWAGAPAGQHIELGISENNLFLMLTALGLCAPLFGTRLIPVGTVYDTFIGRGLDALNYGCYQDSRFLLVGTPSGLTLGPEGGAHQSISTPLIGMGQPSLTYYEPAFADELAAIMRHAFDWIQKPTGNAIYLRLSTRAIRQPARTMEGWESDALKGGYWFHPPKGTEAIAYVGALAPEAMEAWVRLADMRHGCGLLAITSPDLLHREWTAAQTAREDGNLDAEAHIERLLAPLGRSGRLITLIDGSPSALTWIGGVFGQQVRGLGTMEFGQTGDLPDLYRTYRLDADAVIAAADRLFR
jgi:pyruvate dehydrogenase E1 component